MITINSYLHRSTLNNIIRRWMYGEVYSSDADLINRIVHFNNIYVSRYLNLFSEAVFNGLLKSDLYAKSAFLKGDLKDIIVLHPPYHNERIDELIFNYQNDPGRFYRETPFHATLFFIQRDGFEAYIGSSRIKRVHRLAEKAARRIIDRMFDTIKMHADTLAEDRARRLGIRRDQLFTSQEEMIEEFLRAENRLLEDLRYGRPIHDTENMVINDVAGIKVILEDSQQHNIITLLNNMDNCEIVEEEKHSGKYNATNLLLRYSPPKDRMLVKPLNHKIINIMQKKGLNPSETKQAFADFVMSGEDSIYLEIIVSDYEEMLESEIGRCMHEDRIIEQRHRQQYSGHLAKNIEYLMEYLFTFPASPRADLGELPIRIWNHYLPDYFEDIVRKLFQIPEYMVME